MSNPKGYYEDGTPYWVDSMGELVTTDPSPDYGTGMISTGNNAGNSNGNIGGSNMNIEQARAYISNPSEPSGPQTPDIQSMIDKMTGLAINRQYPMRMAGLMGALNKTNAMANSSPMEIGQANAPAFAQAQRGIADALKRNSMMIGPGGGGLLKLGREQGLMPIQQGVAGIPGASAAKGRQRLMDIATNTSILMPQRGQSNSGSSTMSTGIDYNGLQQGYGMLGSGFGRLLGADMGNGMTLGQKGWDWMFPPTPAMPAMPTAPNVSGVNSSGAGMLATDMSSFGGW